MVNTDTYSAGPGEVAEAFNVSIATVRAWDRDGKLVSFRTPGNQRRFKLSENPTLAALLTPPTAPSSVVSPPAIPTDGGASFVPAGSSPEVDPAGGQS